MSNCLPLACTCGAVRGIATRLSPRSGTRLICMCDDCQCYAHHLGRGDFILDRNGGTEVFQVTPAQIEITQGAQHVRCVRLSPKGLMRWYAGCCNTPIANTLPSPKLPFAGLVRVFIDPNIDAAECEAAMGPILGRSQARFGRGPFPPKTYMRASFGLMWHASRVLLRGWMRGAHRPSPFFDPQTGKPVIEPTTVELAEREALRQRVSIVVQ